ncbi:hypothetical protein AU195_01355 [Mycobacterium sp. IS-1496]|uniref:hypothetical protein n=1 Tax=Mycobacterium sp. IS-1496 TaxID=1772284 RepID=UPI00074170F9|nr:hypothetical protein [Mycobacterium sp. IS-1496]KUI24467.1 hypothetical protein AU195_01355 [Mycobacterium sp. IS-1496]
MTADWDRARAVADAVLYEGYLLYPYRATSRKNQARWQFGVLGPPGAAAAGFGEDDRLSAQLLVEHTGAATISLVVRFLQLQHRRAESSAPGGSFVPVDELRTADGSWVTWDEAVAREVAVDPVPLEEVTLTVPINVGSGRDIEHLDGGRLVRTRCDLHAELTVHAQPEGALTGVTITVRNTGATARDKEEAISRSLIGTHLIAEVHDGNFVSLLDPPADAADASARCRHHRCFPVLAGPPGVRNLVLISPIILYDHPEIAEQSGGDLFDSTEIDEILTLRVMTMTDEEKAQARATDPRAAAIVDRCDAMSPEAMLDLHGVLRDPHAAQPPGLIPEVPDGVDWWDPLADDAVAPDRDAVLVGGVRVSRGTRVRLHPTRRADAQDLFYAGRSARVTSVHETVDGDAQIGVVLDDDPAADLHDWYGRYLYFAPDEVEPINDGSPSCT